MLTITGRLQLPQLSPRYLSRSCCRDSPVTCGVQTDNLVSSTHMHGTEMAIFALKQTVDYYRNQDTPVYMCFLDAKKVDRVNHWTLAKKLLDRNVPLHIVKLFIFWNREQEFMVQWDNSLSMRFRCSNGIRQGGQLSPLLYNVYTEYLNHHLQATGVWCSAGGAWVNSLSHADDMVLLATMVTALQTILEVCRHMLDLMTLCTTQRKQYVCWSG